MLPLVCIVVLVLVTLDCSSPQIVTRNPLTSDRIVGGYDADIKDFPHQAALLVDKHDDSGYQLICSGAILSEKYILSSALCLDQIYGNRTLQVRVGSATYEDAQTATVLNYTKHPDYFLDSYNIGVIELSSDLVLNPDTTWPAVLPEVGQTWEDGTDVTVTGWGMVSPEVHVSPVLQRADLDILSGVLCTYLYETWIEATLCVGPQDFSYWNAGACFEDEGGPLVLKGSTTVVGIVSYGACADCPEVGLYTDLADKEIRDFIKGVTGI